MAHLEVATEFVLGIICQNEEDKNQTSDFVATSMKWIRSSFLTNDPITSTILENKDLPESVKKHVLEAKLKILEGNPHFKKAFSERLQAFIRYKARIIGIASTAVGNTYTDDNNNAPNDNFYEKTIVKNSAIKENEDFHLGNVRIQAKENTPIGNSPYRKNTYLNGEKAPLPYQKIKSELKSFLEKGKTRAVIQSLLDAIENRDVEVCNTLLIQSARFDRLLELKKKGVMGKEEANSESHKINMALAGIIDYYYP